MKNRTFCQYLQEWTDITCPVMLKMVKAHGWGEDDQALQDAIDRGDDETARRLTLRLELLDNEGIERADLWIATGEAT